MIKRANGTVVTLLHQNAPLGSGVNELTLDLNGLTPHPTKGNGKKGSITTFSSMKSAKVAAGRGL